MERDPPRRPRPDDGDSIDSPAQAQPERIDAWQVQRLLGRDRLGAYYLCRHHAAERLGAIVLLLDDAPALPDPPRDPPPPAAVEVHLRGLIGSRGGAWHPAFLPVRQVGRCDRGWYLAIERVEAVSLAQRTVWPLGDAVQIGCQLADAIAIAHAHGSAHGMLSPACLLVDAHGKLHIAGLGVAPALAGTTALDGFERADTEAVRALTLSLIESAALAGDEHPSASVEQLVSALRSPHQPAEVRDRLAAWAGPGLIGAGIGMQPTVLESMPSASAPISARDRDAEPTPAPMASRTADTHSSDDPEQLAAAPTPSVEPDRVSDDSRGVGEYVGRYRVLDQLGRGGMGEVLRGYDPTLERPVAIKRIRPEVDFDPVRRARFQREARMIAGLSHPAVVQIFDLVSAGNAEHIIMEFVDGGSLDARVRRGPIPTNELLPLARAIADGLAHAHDRGIVHRDLKLENILLTRDGKPKLADFGIARRLLGESMGEPGLTREGAVVGTYRAMSPEQVQGEEVDARSDLFSLGILLYEAATRVSPFRGESATITVARILQVEPAPVHELVPNLPRALSSLIATLLEKDPQKRPRDAHEVVRRIDDIIAGVNAGPTVGIAAPEPSLPATRASTRPGSEPAASGSVGTAGLRVPSRTDSSRETAERRQVTVVCCELTTLDPTADDEDDPEALLEALPAFHDQSSEVAARFGGTIGHALGPRVLIYFGYPHAHEDSARRAVHAALELTDAVAAQRAHGVAVRTGIHTGTAVVAHSASQPLTLGRTLDLATALARLAAPGEVRVSATLWRLVDDYFLAETVPGVEIPGLSRPGRPLVTHSILEARGVHTRVELAGSLTPLVGRERELYLLTDRWQLAREGMGQVVMLSGEAGIGKSRLVRSFADEVAGEARWLSGYGSPYTQSSPLAPFAALIGHGLFELDGSRSAQTQLARLADGLRGLELDPDEWVPLLAPVLELPLDGSDYVAPDLRPDGLRARTLEALGEVLLATAEKSPVVIVIEDLHWVDPSSLEVLGGLVSRVPTAALLLLGTFRPQFEPPWGQGGMATQIALTRLLSRDVEELTEHVARQVAGGLALPDEVVRAIVATTDGVPLFVEEMTRAILDSGQLRAGPSGYELVEPLRPLRVPETLRDSLAARLDALGEAKDVAQRAAVIGRGFDRDLLSAITPLPTLELEAALGHLVASGLVYPKGARGTYMFKHSLVQEAAYESLLERDRRALHAAIVDALAAATKPAAPELLAHHAERGGRAEDALGHLEVAGHAAAARSAHVEAISHFERARALLASLPAGPARAQREIGLSAALGVSLIATRGYAADEVEASFERAKELCEELGVVPFPIRYGVWAVHFMRGDRAAVDAETATLPDIIAQSDDEDTVLMAQNCLGARTFLTGDQARAGVELTRAMELFSPERHAVVTATYGGCGGFYGHLLTIWHLWLTGHPARSWRHYQDTLALAESLSDPYTEGTVLTFGILQGHDRGSPDLAEAAATRLSELATEQAFPWLLAVATIGRGWVLSQRGERTAGIEMMEQGLAVYRATGVATYCSFYLSLLAESLLEAGRVEQGVKVLDDALDLAWNRLDGFYEAELVRLEGVFHARRGDPATAEVRFRAALDLARGQGAQAIALRAATSLVRLLHERPTGSALSEASADARATAVAELGAIHAGFDDGDAISDLVAATELLDELGRG
ncbi:protein kinase domain-containing protein [Haliangium sp.]|uniref:protein kinase domain-containing protein n=1 Tax=Haliangium sp. TaxID=2663208 RepID=UPI003D0D76FA